MAEVEIKVGAKFDALTHGELSGELDRREARAAAFEREQLRGIKIRRITPLLGVAVGGVLDMGGDNPWPAAPGQAAAAAAPCGPAEGLAWMIRLISIGGLTAGTTPDIVNLYISGQQSQLPWWQFNGNNFAYTFGRREMFLMPGESLHFKSVGTFAATGQITVVGNCEQVPAEMIAKL